MSPSLPDGWHVTTQWSGEELFVGAKTDSTPGYTSTKSVWVGAIDVYGKPDDFKKELALKFETLCQKVWNLRANYAVVDDLQSLWPSSLTGTDARNGARRLDILGKDRG
jgi:hypothetical protein